MARDVTERKKTERALKEVEIRYRELFENANDVLFITDPAGKFLSLNKAGERIGGYSREEALQMSIFDIVLPEYRDKINMMMQLVYEGGRPVAVQGIARDIADRKRPEEARANNEAQLRHTQE